MSRLQLLTVLAQFGTIFVLSLGLGLVILRAIRKILKLKVEIELWLTGPAILAGFGTLAYLALLVGLAGQFNRFSLLAIGVVVLAVSRPLLASWASQVYKIRKHWF